MLNPSHIISKHIGIALLLWLLCSFTTNAQQPLAGKWISYSMTYRSKEIELKKKKDKTFLIFQSENNYVKYYYSYNSGSSSRTLVHDLSGEEVKDSNGRILKKRKAKEQGIYRVQQNEIVFNAKDEVYLAEYKIEGGILFLTEFGNDSLKTNVFTTKFKRVR
jgi:hypothetical protein